MKFKLLLAVSILSVLFLAACSNGDNTSQAENDDVLILKAQLDVPEKAAVNEEIPFKATVSYGDEAVSDADEVKYEVWEEGDKNNSEMIAATNNGDGTYTASKSFDKDGIFHVQVHVTARDQHTMPKQAVTIGEGGQYDETDQSSDDDMSDDMNMDEQGESDSE